MGFGQLGAEGIEGGRALAESLDRRTFEYDVSWRRSEEERLAQAVKYLMTKKSGPDTLRAYGITADTGTLTALLSAEQTPVPGQQQRLEQAFRALRRHNVAPHLTGVLDRKRGARRGTRIEIHPVYQEGVQPSHRRDLRVRHKNIWRWKPIVQAWAAQDSLVMEDLWQELISDMDSDYRSYQYVGHIGICG
ncbi:hypothetical protein [Streptomyces sp. AcH 505]|uniref:hypothetical protein n=1 Tax=Streptomyces sp. AcH 505 TaxID=352211 RepID=UPI000B300214